VTDDVWVHLPGDTVQEISDQLEARGWQVEYATDIEMEVAFPDPDTGHAMRFSGWWLSWRGVGGQLAYGVGDDNADRSWTKRLDLDAEASPEAVAVAADRAMHLLWHCEERDLARRLYEENSLLSAMKVRMQELGRRLLVTPGMIRDALKPSGSWTP
jgi:hypothetical protein